MVISTVKDIRMGQLIEDQTAPSLYTVGKIIDKALLEE
jgi:hypothetical protein